MAMPSEGKGFRVLDAVVYGAFFTLGAFAMGEVLKWIGAKDDSPEGANSDDDDDE